MPHILSFRLLIRWPYIAFILFMFNIIYILKDLLFVFFFEIIWIIICWYFPVVIIVTHIIIFFMEIGGVFVIYILFLSIQSRIIIPIIILLYLLPFFFICKSACFFVISIQLFLMNMWLLWRFLLLIALNCLLDEAWTFAHIGITVFSCFHLIEVMIFWNLIFLFCIIFYIHPIV